MNRYSGSVTPKLTLVVNNDQQTEAAASPADPQAFRRREDREIREKFFDLPLYGPTPQRLPWEFLRAA